MRKKFDFSTLGGISLSIALLFTAIYWQGNLKIFFDPAALIIVIGATFAIIVACFSLTEVVNSVIIIYQIVFFKPLVPNLVAVELIKLVIKLRQKNSLVNIENLITNTDPFFVKACKLVTEGNNTEIISKILNELISSNVKRYQRVISILKKCAETTPAMGLIGTLVGLVQMLSNLSDPSSLGPAMAVALLTTFYGSVLSYLVFFPLASKIERNSVEQMLVEQLYLQAIIAITKQENPRYLENILNSLLPAEYRINYFTES